MKKPLRIAVLQCDQPPPDVVAQYGAYDRIFATLLQTAAARMGLQEADLEITGWDVVGKMEYPLLEDVDGVLISGSKHNSFDDEPWILKLVAFTEVILRLNRVRLVGVCFGHQIIGRALGSRVGRSDAGWEIAVLPVELTELGKQVFGQETLAIHQMHKDIVYSLPPGVQSLGSSPRCANQGMYAPRRLISVQGHPEFHEGIVSRLVKMRNAQGIFNDEQAQDALGRVGNAHDGVVIAQAFLRFLLEE
ncbi:class I glutamine amidotransferase-like protein [Boeremia exigua]|uniref:class I glutamine amidotransferase-like protein n=1 Tax=Boeremia exigua TaxID=749465 RepID=UPI001E8EC392|nr:class I glutamine amidotransferase-like protein [Boeremia exigua]KAH6614000.1 class I glutamine amidotransferase-like protein [Boeremia exigua]